MARPTGDRTLRAGLAAFALAASPAHAACSLDHAIYGPMEGVGTVEFMPDGGMAAVTNSFRMMLGKKLVLEGIVMWTEGVRRPTGMLSHNCPEGDVTGEELAVCTVWQGVIYTVDGSGAVGLLPPQTAEAPARLIFPDLGPSLRHSAAYGANGFTEVPWDVFELKSCRD